MASTPYDIWNVAIQTAQERLNDRVETIAAVGAKILDIAQPQVQRICGAAFRKFQEYLASMKYSGMEQEAPPMINVPAVTNADPLVQVYISYAGYFDGANLQPAPVLPQTLARPYKLWERTNGTTNVLTEMDEVINGLASVPKMNWNRSWEWRDDVLYMPGASQNTDIRMRYGAFFPDPVDNSPVVNTPWYGQAIQIMRCIDPLADYMCREIQIAREDPDGAASFQASGEAGARLIVMRDTTQPQATPTVAQLNKMSGRYTAMEGKPRTAKR